MKFFSDIKFMGLFFIILLTGLFALVVPDALAQGGIGKAKDIDAPDLSASLVVKRIQQTLVFVSSILAVVFVAIGGIRYASSNGNPAQIESAKKTITYALTGLLLAILAAALVGFVINRGPN
jgi:hypothetical protein